MRHQHANAKHHPATTNALVHRRPLSPDVSQRGRQLIAVSLILLEMAEEALAAHETDHAQSLVELTMSGIYTAISVCPASSRIATGLRRKVAALALAFPESDDD